MKIKVWRDAESGQIIDAVYAAERPESVVHETIEAHKDGETWKAYRHAKTGRWITKLQADESPEMTLCETIHAHQAEEVDE